MFTNPGKLALAKGIAIFVNAFFPKLPNQESKDPLDWIILYIWVWLGFISIDMLLGKAFIFVVCLVVRNNSCGNSSSSKFFLVNLNVAPVLFFAVDFNLFNCAFFS